MKKLINDPRNVTREMLEGLADLFSGHAILADENVIIRADTPAFAERREVAIISGGGSGHEPAHAGYVGKGMLHAAVCGDVFTSPSADAVLAAIKAVAGPPGALLIVKNYTGDRLNFGLAAALARHEGYKIELVVVADDVALRDTVAPGRRRGIAGTVFVHKIAGAASLAGDSLAQVADAARDAAAVIGTMGVALGACTVPEAGRPGFELGEHEAELGLGIHGERGVRRTDILRADEFVEIILKTLLEDAGLTKGDHVALLVNGLGGTPPMELAIVARKALSILRQSGLVVDRAWSGMFMTALEMPGCSISLMRLNDQRLQRLDAPTQAPGWAGKGMVAERKVLAVPQPDPPKGKSDEAAIDQGLKSVLLAIASAFETEEAYLTALDSGAGDGDLGISFRRGADAVKALKQDAYASPAIMLTALSMALRRSIAGSSGPFYATALLRAARQIGDAKTPSSADWQKAFSAAVAEVIELGGARPGDRTMVDALQPAATAFAQALEKGKPSVQAWEDAVIAAQEGAKATTDMVPQLGRASYVGARAIGLPDAGAQAVVIWMQVILQHCKAPSG